MSAKDALVMIVQTFFMQKINTNNSTYSIPVLQKLIEIIETYYRIDKKKIQTCPSHIFFLREVKISLIELYSYHNNWEMPTTSNITSIGYD